MSSSLMQQDASPAVPLQKYRQQHQTEPVLEQYARMQQEQQLYPRREEFALTPSPSELQFLQASRSQMVDTPPGALAARRLVTPPATTFGPSQAAYASSRRPDVQYAQPGLQQPFFADMRREAPESAQARRFNEPAKFLPVVFLSVTMLMLYLIYVLSHGMELLQLDVSYLHRDEDMRQRGIAELVIFNVLTFFLVICYARSVLTPPGGIPESDSRWDYIGDLNVLNDTGLAETKKSGQRRHCKWCAKYKPDRCHHCRVCRTCILKMDHHCPWIYNCVGFKNQKFFWLFLFYAVGVTQFIVWTMMESLIRSVAISAPFVTMFLHLFGVTLAFFLGFLLIGYFGFHCWLMVNSLTTIEFCEKTAKVTANGKDKKKSSYSSIYSTGLYGNICSVLGDNPLLWFIPVNPASGDGLSFGPRLDSRPQELDPEYRYNKHVA